MNYISYIWSKFRSRHIGQDKYGNTYYEDKQLRDNGKKRRWVAYAGQAEASKIPPQWHAWIHYVIDEAPLSEELYSWQKPHQRNVTGTRLAYRPSSWFYKEKAHQETDYEPWRP